MIAHRSRDALRRHPWMLDIRDDPAPGPNGVRHRDQSMQAVSSLDLSVGERFDLVLAIDEYVFGFCTIERANGLLESERRFAPGFEEVREYVSELAASGAYPALSAMWADPGLDEAWTQMQKAAADPGRFDRNLALLLDGFEAGMRRPRRR